MLAAVSDVRPALKGGQRGELADITSDVHAGTGPPKVRGTNRCAVPRRQMPAWAPGRGGPLPRGMSRQDIQVAFPAGG